MTIASICASVDQDRKQLPANTRVKMVLMHIDRMFDSVPVGGPFAKRHSESISDDLACMVGDEMRQVAWPSRSELINYTSVVLTTLIIMISLIFVLNLAFGKLVTLLFTK